MCAFLSCRQAWTARIALFLQTTISDIGRCLNTPLLACIKFNWHRVWHYYIAFGLHKMDNWRQMWLASPFAYTQCLVDIRRGLPTSPFACTQWLTNVGHELNQSFLAYINRSVDVTHCMLALSVAHTHLSADIWCAVPATFVACIWWLMAVKSSKALTHWL